MKRYIGCTIIILLLTILFTGCNKININFTTGLSKNEVYKIGDEVCSLEEAKFLLAIEKSTYENSFTETVWDQKLDEMEFEEYVKLSVKNEMAELTCLNLLAKEKNITLTTSEKQKIKDIANLYYNDLSKQIDNSEISINIIQNVLEKYAISEKLYKELTDNLEWEISDVEAKVIKVQHIFIKTYKLNDKEEKIIYSDDEIEKAKQKVEDIYSSIKTGEDFYTLATENSDDKNIEYTFCRSEMIKEFSDAAFALNEGEVSKIIETENGFYIIKSISTYMIDESVAKKAELIENKKAEVFKNEYNPFVNTLTSEFNNNLWDELEIKSITSIPINLYDVFEENYNL